MRTTQMPTAAALREAEEEIALDRSQVEILGRMADYVTGTGYRITPVLGLLPPGLRLRPAPDEVEAVFELPIDVLLDPDAPKRQRHHVRGVWREYLGVAASRSLHLGRDRRDPRASGAEAAGSWGRMLRLVELALFLTPFVVFAIWRFAALEAGRVGPRRGGCRLRTGCSGGLLIWLSEEDALPPGARYEPARMQNGRVISGHAASQ